MRKESNESPLLYFTKNQANKHTKIGAKGIIVDFGNEIWKPKY